MSSYTDAIDMVHDWMDAPHEECIEWGGGTRSGYGVVAISGHDTTNGLGFDIHTGGQTGTHRLALDHISPWHPPLGLFACHGRICAKPLTEHGGRLCMNPHHSDWGTGKRNALDRTLDGTQVSKLTEAQVLRIDELLTDGTNEAVIAQEFGVHKQTVINIKTGQAWSQITGRTATS